MTTRRALRAAARFVAGVALDLLDVAAFFAGVVLLTLLLGLALPGEIAFVIALLGVGIAFGIWQAARIDRARRERGEL